MGMRKNKKNMKQFLIGIGLAISMGATSYTAFSQTASLQKFPLQAVRLSESPFKAAQQTDLKYILEMDADRLLAPFLREAGLTPKKPSYGNWENSGLDGHIGGHYLSALANMYASTGNKEILQRLHYMIDELEKCQQQNGNDYIGGVPGGSAIWKEITAGNIRAQSFSLNGKWVPLYNIHKTYAGLLDAWQIAGIAKAKTMLVKLSDWFYTMLSGLSDEQVQDMLRSEHGGLNEVFADLYELTADKKYLSLAERMSHLQILNPLLQHKDSLTGFHANTQIPKVIGYTRIADVGGNGQWRDAANFFWETVVNNRTVSIGGNSVREHFHPAGDFSSMIEDKEGPETCNTYNMLKLSKFLFLANPQLQYMDYYEQAVYNHILSSQHPDGGFVYFTTMRPRHYRVYSAVHDGMWCCVGSGIENHGKYGEMIYAHNGNDLFVNLFIASSLNWKEKNIQLTQQTNFPYSNQSTLQVSLQKKKKFALYIRYPSWAKNGTLQVTVNDKPVTVSKNQFGYLSIHREWKNGDKIKLSLPMQIEAEPLPDRSSWVSFKYGPIVLGATTDTTDLKGLVADDGRMSHIAHGTLYPLDQAPVMVAAKNEVISNIQPVAGKPLHFTASKIIYPNQYKQLTLQPFYTIHDSRYMLYWYQTDEAGYTKMVKELEEKEKIRLALEALTVDQVSPGQQQPESDHQFKEDKSQNGLFKDRHWRKASGWFSYELRNTNNAGKKIRLTVFAKDKNNGTGIYINDVLLKEIKLDGNGADDFTDIEITIPENILSLLKNEKLTIKFAPLQDKETARIFYIRLMK